MESERDSTFWFDAFSSREPASTSLENALAAPGHKFHTNGAQRFAPFCFWADFPEMLLATSRARRDNLISQLTNTVETTCSTNQPPNPQFVPPARSPDSASPNSPASARVRPPA